MELDHETDAIREYVDDLAQRCAGVSDWRLADARLFAALVEGNSQLTELQQRMIELVKCSRPNWTWFDTHACVRHLVENLAELRVLRMCVRSRIYELEAGATQRAP